MDFSRYLNPDIAAVPKSGIRKFFDVAATMPGAISLGVGEPDFVTPYHIRNAAIDSLLDGETQPSAKKYRYNSSVTFRVGDRVKIDAADGTYIVAYPIA